MFNTCDVYGSKDGNTSHVFAQFQVTSLAGRFVDALQGASNVDAIKVVDNNHKQVTYYTKTPSGHWQAKMAKLDTASA